MILHSVQLAESRDNCFIRIRLDEKINKRIRRIDMKIKNAEQNKPNLIYFFILFTDFKCFVFYCCLICN